MSHPYRIGAAVVPDDAPDEGLDFWLRLEVEAQEKARQAAWVALLRDAEVRRIDENLARRRHRLFALAMLAERGDEVTADALAALAPEVHPLRSPMDMAPMWIVQL